MAEDLVSDISTESLFVGELFNHPEDIEEYESLVSPEYDFVNPDIKFCYNLLLECYLRYTNITDTSINLVITQRSEEDKAEYQRLKGYKIFLRLSGLAKAQEDIYKTYNKLKSLNVLRYLQKMGFPVSEHINQLKDRSVDSILKIYELGLVKAGAFVKNIADGVNAGDHMVDFWHSLLQNPSVGESIYTPIINSEFRGLRLGCVSAIGALTNFGKSRFIVRLLTDLCIVRQVPALLIINETTKEEFQLMLLTCVVNNIINKNYGYQVINETNIAIGSLSDMQKKMVEEAAQLIEKQSKLIIFPTYIYDARSLKLIIRKYQLRDHIKLFFYDILKPFHQENRNMATWEALSSTVDELKKLAVELNIHIMFTFQLNATSAQEHRLSLDQIQGSKQISNHIDHMVQFRELSWKEKEKYKVKIFQKDNPFSGQVCDMNPHEKWAVAKIIKNRGGRMGMNIAFKISQGECIFDEKGLLLTSGENI